MKGNGTWQHLQKSSIESSPVDGATLSSDLLCLCKFDKEHVLSGGVDGRLHVWNSVSMGTPVFCCTAHEGRVNAIERANQSRDYIFTAGYDGKVKCWRCIPRFEKVELVDEYAMGESRVTSLWTFHRKGTDYVLCGTNEGEVGLLSLRTEENTLKWETIFQLAQQSMVNAICVEEQENENPHVWIGHSEGLSIFSLASFINLE